MQGFLNTNAKYLNFVSIEPPKNSTAALNQRESAEPKNVQKSSIFI
jgi:hypothetical protein